MKTNTSISDCVSNPVEVRTLAAGVVSKFVPVSDSVPTVDYGQGNAYQQEKRLSIQESAVNIQFLTTEHTQPGILILVTVLFKCLKFANWCE